MEIKEAYTELEQAAALQFENIGTEVIDLLKYGQFDSARKKIDQAEKMFILFQNLKNLVEKWHHDSQPIVGPPPMNVQPESSRTAPGSLTPQSRFRIFILKALVEMGGQGRTGEVIDRVGLLMESILNDDDRGILVTVNEPHWRNRSRYERMAMVNEGLLSDQSEDGVWEITDKGKEYLINRTR